MVPSWVRQRSCSSKSLARERGKAAAYVMYAIPVEHTFTLERRVDAGATRQIREDDCVSCSEFSGFH